MDFQQIQDLIKLIKETDLSEVTLEMGDFKLSVRAKDYHRAASESTITVPSPATFAPAAAPAPAPTPVAPAAPVAATKLLEVRSPIVGTFYRSASPDKPPYIKVGDKINKGAVVCIVEAMKLFNEIESDVAGKVMQVMVNDASPVEYDQVLFLIDPNG